MNKHGQLTSKVADAITGEMNKRGFAVYYDHGDRSNPFVGTIVPSIGAAPVTGEELSELDIAIIDKSNNHVIALIEIEESSDTPKDFLGDIFGILVGNSISFKGNAGLWKSGEWTTMIIIGNGTHHEKRNIHIREKAMKAKSALETENSKIGNIVIESFVNYEELKKVLVEQIDVAIRRNA